MGFPDSRITDPVAGASSLVPLQKLPKSTSEEWFYCHFHCEWRILFDSHGKLVWCEQQYLAGEVPDA